MSNIEYKIDWYEESWEETQKQYNEMILDEQRNQCTVCNGRGYETEMDGERHDCAWCKKYE